MRGRTVLGVLVGSVACWVLVACANEAMHDGSPARDSGADAALDAVSDALFGDSADAKADDATSPVERPWSVDAVDCDKQYNPPAVGSKTIWAVKDYAGRTKEDLARVRVMICGDLDKSAGNLPDWADCHAYRGDLVLVKDGTLAVACFYTGGAVTGPTSVKFLLPPPL